ncbi:MAG: transglutaminase domain-containing protein [Planctomycetota bacterium]|nr:transglutaminase domain-containing protein [Planctomycetota bacterium]
MSRLYLSESGRALAHNNEEITRWRWAKKQLGLPKGAVGARADLWLFLYLYKGNRKPLRVELNGKHLADLGHNDTREGGWNWCSVSVPPGRLKAGVNEFILSCDAPAMNAWILGIENGSKSRRSFLSLDRGKNWQKERMGAHGVLQGEYLVRLRSFADGQRGRRLPGITLEDSNHPKVVELLQVLPNRIQNIKDPWKQMRALRTWVAQYWSHDPFGASYTPWDPLTVLDWVRRDICHGRKGGIGFCVHFAVVLAAFAAALGHKARCFAVTTEFGSGEGHFMAEVWDEKLGKWVLHDPNYDMHYEGAAPFSAIEAADFAHNGKSLKKFVVKGKGFPKGPPRVLRGYRLFAGATPFNNYGVWAHNNYVSNPLSAPPNHGTISYCETDFVWYCPEGMDLAPMFPYRTSDRSYFEKPPG